MICDVKSETWLMDHCDVNVVFLSRRSTRAAVLGRLALENRVEGDVRRPAQEDGGGVERLSGPAVWTGRVRGGCLQGVCWSERKRTLPTSCYYDIVTC